MPNQHKEKTFERQGRYSKGMCESADGTRRTIDIISVGLSNMQNARIQEIL